MKTSPSTAIVTDSTADLDISEAEALQVNVVPALLTIEGKSYQDGEGLSRMEFYQRLPQFTEPPTTAAPSSRAFAAAYEHALTSGAERILSIHLSEKLSGMMNAAHQAAREFGDRVHLFDSGQVSLGVGFQVMAAAMASLAGRTFEAVLDAANRAREKVRIMAMINTLEYLRRSGRVSWLQSGLGNLLQVKLLVTVVDGAVARLAQIRTRKKSLEQMMERARAWGPLERLAIIHTAAAEEAASIGKKLRTIVSNAPLVRDVTTVLGTHVGPNSIGVVGLMR
ncbi:MAG: DegV family protein [Anaerolineales bacterium]